MKNKIKICIVRSLYNNTSKLLESATRELVKRKIIFKVLEVPGAFEIPVVVAKNINTNPACVSIRKNVIRKHKKWKLKIKI